MVGLLGRSGSGLMNHIILWTRQYSVVEGGDSIVSNENRIMMISTQDSKNTEICLKVHGCDDHTNIGWKHVGSTM